MAHIGQRDGGLGKRISMRIGKNIGGYFGETVDVRAMLRDAAAAAQEHGWSCESFHPANDFNLLALHRPALSPRTPRSALRIYISAGIHGDEPAGPVAALRLVRENLWPAHAEIFLLPCLNPAGFALNRRANADGVDLNRDYRTVKSPEVRAHIAWLERQPRFDIYLCLHEDWESHGFYLYEQNPDARPSLAARIVESARRVCPIDESPVIEGRVASGGVIRPVIQPHERPDWPEALYLITRKARLGYTLEAPSDFALPVRVDALVAGVRAAVSAVAKG